MTDMTFDTENVIFVWECPDCGQKIRYPGNEQIGIEGGCVCENEDCENYEEPCLLAQIEISFANKV